jgi:hypothetical protein
MYVGAEFVPHPTGSLLAVETTPILFSVGIRELRNLRDDW